MKRIIDGVTYNTDTATRIAEGSWDEGEASTETVLYQSRTGVYFVVDTVRMNYRDRKGEWQQTINYEWERVENANEYCEKYALTILRQIEDMPPEAEPGEKLATLYVRLPPALKSAIEGVAKRQGLSTNVFALRCLERCVSDSNKDALAAAFAGSTPPSPVQM